ncbi:hypothetical protein [Paenibacillus sp. FSL H7-0323]|jgi:hypothetical protein|uniref:hypothetical protein n=1 Tax=Paenibacillus sp. FSL H7-0323 TaxID=2921433 RepID=UPI0030F54332
MEQTKKKMRGKWFIMSLVGLILLAGVVGYFLNDKYNWISSVSTTPNYDYTPDQFTAMDLSIFDTKKKKQIGYGMEKPEVERIIGKPIDKGMEFPASHPLESLVYPDGLQIVYRLDRVVEIIVSADGLNRYVTMRNIGLSNGPNDHLVVYGLKPTVSSEDWDTYLFEKINNSFKKLNENAYAENQDLTVYQISFQRENGKLVSISISDMLFAVKHY